MKLLYAKNCDIYYDSMQEAIVLSKRGLHFLLKRPIEDMEIIKDILKLCYFACDIESAFASFSEEKRDKYLQFTKLLWQKRILVEEIENTRLLRPAIVEMLIGNYDANPSLITFWTSTQMVFSGLDNVRKAMMEFGIACTNYAERTLDNRERIYVGNFTKEQCKELLDGKNKVILYREEEGTSYMLYLARYDEDKYERFSSFAWTQNSSFYAKESMLPIHMFMHISNCYCSEKSPELLCITNDGAVQSFFIEKLREESARYYNREVIPQVEEGEALTRIERLVESAPYLVAGCNENNENLPQSPICNYEIVFGTEFGNDSYMAFHENYIKAGLNAFTEGLEWVLNKNSDKTWCCGVSKNDYYAKGYISLLEEGEECYELEEFDETVLGRLCYLESVLAKRIKVYYRSSKVDGIGGIILCDENGYILYDGKMDYQLKENLMKAIYKLVGELQNHSLVEANIKLVDRYSICDFPKTLLEELTAEEVVEKLQRYFGDMYKIIDEKIWAYQVQIQDTGIHVGTFFFVK